MYLKNLMIHYFQKIPMILILLRYPMIPMIHYSLMYQKFLLFRIFQRIQKNLKFQKSLKNLMCPQDFHP
jgi:hypothetical protein